MADVSSIPGVSGVSTDRISAGFSNFMSSAGLYIVIFFAVVLFAVMLWLIYYLLSFNVTCHVEEKMKDGTTRTYIKKAKTYYDRKKDGDYPLLRMKIFGMKKPLMFPSYSKDGAGGFIKRPLSEKQASSGLEVKVDDFSQQLWGVTQKGKSSLRLIKDGDEFTAVPWANEDVQKYLKVSMPVRQQWANNLLRESWELFAPKQGFFEKYGSMIMMGGTLVIIMIIFIVLFNKFDEIEQLSAALNNYAGAMTDFAKALRETGVQRLA